MDKKKAGLLLRKFYSGETTLEEEKALHDFFSVTTEVLPPELAADKEIFLLLSEEKEGGIPEDELHSMLDEVTTGQGKQGKVLPVRRMLYPLAAAAASLALILSVYLGYVHYRNKNPEQDLSDTYRDNPAMAYAETKRVLLYVSQQMNRGTGELSSLSLLAEPVEKLKPLRLFENGMDKLQVLDQLNEAIKKEEKGSETDR